MKISILLSLLISFSAMAELPQNIYAISCINAKTGTSAIAAKMTNAPPKL